MSSVGTAANRQRLDERPDPGEGGGIGQGLAPHATRGTVHEQASAHAQPSTVPARLATSGQDGEDGRNRQGGEQRHVSRLGVVPRQMMRPTIRATRTPTSTPWVCSPGREDHADEPPRIRSPPGRWPSPRRASDRPPAPPQAARHGRDRANGRRSRARRAVPTSTRAAPADRGHPERLEDRDPQVVEHLDRQPGQPQAGQIDRQDQNQPRPG